MMQLWTAPVQSYPPFTYILLLPFFTFIRCKSPHHLSQITNLGGRVPDKTTQCVACQQHGTTVRGFLPRAWDHLVASDGTTRRVVLGVLITSGIRCLQVDRLGGRGMAFREVAVTEIREVLRAWLSGAGLRKVAEQAGVDRKTARRYVQAAVQGRAGPRWCAGAAD